MRLSLILVVLLALALEAEAAKAKGKRKAKKPKKKPPPRPPPPKPKPVKYCISKYNDDMNAMLEKYLQQDMIDHKLKTKVKVWCLAARIADAKEYKKVFNFTVISQEFSSNLRDYQRVEAFVKKQGESIRKLAPLDQYGLNEQVAFGCRWYLTKTDCLFLTEDFYANLILVVDTIARPKNNLIDLESFWKGLQPF